MDTDLDGSAGTRPVDRVIADLDGVPRVPERLVRARSRDFFWFSPILKAELDDKVADAAFVPRDRAELKRVAAACARHRVPLTVRGGGTGNYGQAVPLAGGIVVDMTGLNRTVALGPGFGRFEGGAKLLDIDRALRSDRWELRFHPSTRQHATIAGFVAGGAGGVGSCTWGQLADPGAVNAIEVLTVEEEPRFIELKGREALSVMHAYGLNGIITEVELPLAPWHPWAERIAVFPSMRAACTFANAFTAAEGIAKKLVSVHEPRIPPMIARLRPLVPEGRAMVLLMVSEAQVVVTQDMIRDHGGDVVYARGHEEAEIAAFEGRGNLVPLYEFAWNHTTLHAMKTTPDLTYLQVRYPAAREVEIVEELTGALGDEVLFHLEYQRRFGRVFVSSLPLVRYTTPERLAEIVTRIEASGAQVSNPHTYKLQDAGWKRVDAPQREFKRIADPYGLMNPGKLD